MIQAGTISTGSGMHRLCGGAILDKLHLLGTCDDFPGRDRDILANLECIDTAGGRPAALRCNVLNEIPEATKQVCATFVHGPLQHLRVRGQEVGR